MKGKNAQAAAIGVLIIGILIVGYLTLIPKSDKCRNNPDLAECKDSLYVNESEALLNEAPGLLQPLEDSVEYSLGSIDLFMRENTEIPFAISLDPTVEKSWFNTKKISQEFEVPGKAKRVIVIVGIAESQGFASLSVIVNDHVVERIVGAGAHFVEVPTDIIKRNNLLEIVPSTPLVPGITNKFSINYLALKETYTTTQPQIDRSFMLEQDVNDISSAVLTFTGNCYSKDNLKVRLNNETIVNENICKLTLRRGNIFIIGDAACHTKFSGGGIVPSLEAAIAINDLIAKGDSKRIKSLSKEIMMHEMIAKLLGNLNAKDFDYLFEIAGKSDLKIQSRDEMRKWVFSALIKNPKIIFLGRKLFKLF